MFHNTAFSDCRELRCKVPGIAFHNKIMLYVVAVPSALEDYSTFASGFPKNCPSSAILHPSTLYVLCGRQEGRQVGTVVPTSG